MNLRVYSLYDFAHFFLHLHTLLKVYGMQPPSRAENSERTRQLMRPLSASGAYVTPTKKADDKIGSGEGGDIDNYFNGDDTTLSASYGGGRRATRRYVAFLVPSTFHLT